MIAKLIRWIKLLKKIVTNFPAVCHAIMSAVIFLAFFKSNRLSINYFFPTTVQGILFRKIVDTIYPSLTLLRRKKINSIIWRDWGHHYQIKHDDNFEYSLEDEGPYIGEALVAKYLLENFDAGLTYYEIGCGNGKFLNFLNNVLKNRSKVPRRFFGVDMDKKCIKFAKSIETDGKEFYQGDVFKIFSTCGNLENCIVISIGVLPYLNPEEMEEFAHRLKERNWSIILRESFSSLKAYQGGLRWKHDYHEILKRNGFEISLFESFKGLSGGNIEVIAAT